MKGKGKINIGKIVDILLNVLVLIFCVILLMSIYIGVQTKVLKKNYADFFGYSMFEVQTGSMEETISPEDWIIVKLTKKVKLNDIITYEYKGEYITHRIIEVYNGTYITKGDANSAKDDPVDESQVVGEVVKILPGFGVLRKTVFNPPVIIALIITLLLFNIALKKPSDNKILKFLKSKFKKTTIDKKLEENIKIEKMESEIENNNIEINKDEIDSLPEEGELNQTVLFRVVSVDSSEIDNTLLEAAKSKINNNEKQNTNSDLKTKNIPEKVEPAVENLDEIKKKQNMKKANNLIESVMLLKEEELNDIMNLFIKEVKNGVSIKNDFIKLYIKSKYYNLHEDKNTTIKTVTKNIKLDLKDNSNELFKQKPKYRSIINDCLLTLSFIANIEQARETIDDTSVRNEFYKKEIMKYSNNWDEDFAEDMANKIDHIQSNYSIYLKDLMSKLDTTIFELKCEPLKNYKSIYGVRLNHNLSFSKVYSDYIIDKTYSEGIVAEDKILVLISLFMRKLIEDMTNYQFGNKYLLNIPGSLYLKEKKIASILKTIDNDYIKSNVYITLTFEDLVNNKKMIKEIRKKGYGFALFIDKEYKILPKDLGYLYLVDHIFWDKTKVNSEQMMSYIPKDLQKIVKYENIEEKLGIKGE